MFKCEKCRREFEAPEKYPDYSDEFWGFRFVKHYEGCPYCKSEDFFEIKYHCDCCNISICKGDVYYETADKRIFCEDCITKRRFDGWITMK